MRLEQYRIKVGCGGALRRSGAIDILCGNKTFLEQRLGAAQGIAGLFSRRAGFGDRRLNGVSAIFLRVYAALGEHNLFIQRGKRSFGLRQVHFIGPGIDAKQQIALLDLLVIANRQFDNAAADFRNHINRIR